MPNNIHSKLKSCCIIILAKSNAGSDKYWAQTPGTSWTNYRASVLFLEEACRAVAFDWWVILCNKFISIYHFPLLVIFEVFWSTIKIFFWTCVEFCSSALLSFDCHFTLLCNFHIQSSLVDPGRPGRYTPDNNLCSSTILWVKF